MGVVDDDTDLKMTPKHKKFADDPDAVSISREELEALKAEIAENKRRSLQNETRSIIVQDRSLANQKRPASERDAAHGAPVEPPAPIERGKSVERIL